MKGSYKLRKSIGPMTPAQMRAIARLTRRRIERARRDGRFNVSTVTASDLSIVIGPVQGSFSR